MAARDEHPLPTAHGGGGPGMITDDRACRACGYNLRGLAVGGACPECGAPIRLSNAKDEELAAMPKAVIRRVRRGVFALAFAWGVTVVGGVGAFIYLLNLPPSWVEAWMAGGAVGAAALLAVATWMATPVIEHEAAAERGFTKRDQVRRLARWLTPMWIGAAGIGLTATLLPKPTPGWTDALLVTSLALFVTAGAVGMGALCLHVERVAEWTRDRLAAETANLVLWMTPGPFALAIWLVTMSSWGISFIEWAAGILWVLLLGMAALGTLLLAMALGMLAGSVSTCLKHADEYAERDRRRREREQREAAELEERMAGL